MLHLDCLTISNSSAAPLLDVLPLPKDRGFSRFFANSTNSATVLAGKSAFTVSIIGIVMMPATGAKSALGS
jgi:hypothetical protein